jgi:hypothetical protein
MTDVLTYKQIKKHEHNTSHYNKNKNTFKLSYYFRTYPYIKENHSVEIAEYLRTNGEDVDDNFIEFIRSFVIPNGRPTHYKPRSVPTKKRLPKILQTILTTNYDSSSSDETIF